MRLQVSKISQSSGLLAEALLLQTGFSWSNPLVRSVTYDAINSTTLVLDCQEPSTAKWTYWTSLYKPLTLQQMRSMISCGHAD